MKFVIPGPPSYQLAITRILKRFSSSDKVRPETIGDLELTRWYGETSIIIQASHTSARAQYLNLGSPMLSFESGDPKAQARKIRAIFGRARLDADVYPGVPPVQDKMWIVELPEFPHLRFCCTLYAERMPKEMVRPKRGTVAKIRPSYRAAKKEK